MKKPINFIIESPPRPWRIAESVGMKLYIYANKESSPIPLLKSKKRMTRKELATLQMIVNAVNHYNKHA